MLARKVFMLCSGLGEIQRGYESFTRENFDVLMEEPLLKMYLYKGGGKDSPAQNEYRLWNLKRRYRINGMLARLFRRDAYFFEQLSFFFSLVFPILRHKPDVIYFSDFLLGCWLSHFRRFLHLEYKLVFSNGAPNGPPFPLFDHVHHLTRIHRQEALAGGEPVERHTVIPYGFRVPPEKDSLLDATHKKRLRKLLGLAEDKRIVLSVGNVNAHHKRMDYLIREFAEAAKKRSELYLLILGQVSEQSAEILKLAQALLTPEQYTIKTVPYEEIQHYYRCADLFVLCSLKEGFGRVYLEAMMYGLPVVAHDFGVAREVMGVHAIYAKLDQEGSLSQFLLRQDLNPDFQSGRERFLYVRDHFSWNVLKDQYKEMLLKV